MVAGENGDFLIDATQRTEDLGVVVTADHKWVDRCNADTRKIRESSLGYSLH